MLIIDGATTAQARPLIPVPPAKCLVMVVTSEEIPPTSLPKEVSLLQVALSTPKKAACLALLRAMMPQAKEEDLLSVCNICGQLPKSIAILGG